MGQCGVSGEQLFGRHFCRPGAGTAQAWAQAHEASCRHATAGWTG
jgi:hypothetical protein